MSRDVERLLRDVPAEFPGPDPGGMSRLQDRVLGVSRTRRRRRRIVQAAALTAATALGAAGGHLVTVASAGGAGEAPEKPTIRAHVWFGGGRQVDLSGRVPSGRPGERVEILERVCGERFDRIRATATIEVGGHWAAGPFLVGGTSKFFTARWEGKLSEPVFVRVPINVTAARVPGRRAWTVTIYVRPQNLARRPVILQRLSASGQWVRVRQAPLRAVSYGRFEATFAVRQRGLTLRVAVPSATAGRCYQAAATRPWRS